MIVITVVYTSADEAEFIWLFLSIIL